MINRFSRRGAVRGGPRAHTRSATQARPAPVSERAVHPAADHRTEADADAALQQIERRQLATIEGMDLLLTDADRGAAAKLSVARLDSLAELLGDWSKPDRPTDLVELVDELSSQLSGSDGERPHVPAPRFRARRT